ncbi:MAG: hypothetical protein JKX72_05935 [Robiginitomaculum sp.]|nr:hypothetical protein [Robiginitomaculum sp.]
MSDKKPETGLDTDADARDGIDDKKTSAGQHKSSRKKTDTKKDQTEKTPAFNSIVHPKEKAKTHQKGISRAGAVFLALLATLMGGSIGWLGPAMFKSTSQTDAITQTVAALQADLNTQTKARKTIEQTLKTLQNRIKTNTGNTAKLGATVSEQSQNIDVLTNAQADNNQGNDNFASLESNLLDLTNKVDAQLALNMKDGATGAGANTLLTRLSALESQITELQKSQIETVSSVGFPSASAEPIDLPDTHASKTLSENDRTEILRVLVESFPRKEMLAAVEAQQKIALKKPSWLQKTLSKHIKVRDDNTPPLTIINSVEAAIKAGRIEDALAGIKKLNPPVRAMTIDWVIAAKQAQKILQTSVTNELER